MIPYLIASIVLVIIFTTLNFACGWELHIKFANCVRSVCDWLVLKIENAKQKRVDGAPQREAVRLKNNRDNARICTNCGAVNRIAYEEKGSDALGCVLMLFFFLPGILYLVVKRFSRYEICSSCKMNTLVRGDSPVGADLLKKYREK